MENESTLGKLRPWVLLWRNRANEYELDLLRQRSVEARRAKAQRGELLVAASVGYIRRRNISKKIRTV